MQWLAEVYVFLLLDQQIEKENMETLDSWDDDDIHNVTRVVY